MKHLMHRVSHYFPTALPKTEAEFDDFCQDLFNTYQIPDKPSYRHAVASMIMHLETTRASMPKRYFIDSIRKAQANEIAYSVIEAIRKQDKLDREKKTQEATQSSEPHLECVQAETI